MTNALREAPDHAAHIAALDALRALVPALSDSAAPLDRSGLAPKENIHLLHQRGLLALSAPHAVGGAGAGLQTLVEVVGLLGRAEPSTALIALMQYVSMAFVAESDWPEPAKQQIFADAINTGALVNSLRVEPRVGSPWRGGMPDTILRRTADGWRLSGRKTYATGSTLLRWGLIWARTDETPPRVGNVLAPMRAEGVRMVETWDHLGMRASASHDVIFENVSIAPEHALDMRPPDAWAGSQRPLEFIWICVLLAALYNGVAESAQAWTIDFLRTRTPGNLGAPLASLPLHQQVIGENEAQLALSRRLLRSAARDWDDTRALDLVEAGRIKMSVTEAAIAVVERALRLTGNHGLSRANPLERHYRDVLCGRIHNPQADLAHQTAGRVALGIA